MVRWLAAVFAGVLAVQAAQVKFLKGVLIVQYEDDHDPSAVLDVIRRKHDVKVRREFNFKLFKGADFLFSDVEKAGFALDELRTMPGVKGAWQSRLFERPEVTIRSIGNGDMGHEEVKRDVQHDNFSPHVMTQVNLLRDAGHVGKGFKVALVDSGVDYLHPALGGGFGPGHLVSFGTDLVGDAYNGSNTPMPDHDPLDVCAGHGTHVAGIIAAQADKNPYGIIGAATGVSIGSYRVFGCDGVTDESLIIAAYHQAFEDGADLIHASIGGRAGWSEGAWAAAVASIVAHGVSCTASAGNHGDEGLFFAQHAADATGVAAVASVDSVLIPSLQVDATYSVNGGASVAFGFSPSPPTKWTAQTLPLWTPVTKVSDTFDGSISCNPFPDTTPNLGKYVVLVPSGPCKLDQFVSSAVQWGAKHILMYNTDLSTTWNDNNVTGLGITFGVVTKEQGAEWVKLLLSGAKVDVHMVDQAKAPVVVAHVNNTQTGGYMSSYTTWGPTWELAIKPQFAAPGRDILSTWPRALGGYAIISGTSMAAPLGAAMFVLMMETTGIRDPAKLGRLLTSTAKQLDYSDGNQTRVGVPAPVPQQGAGIAQAFEASRARTMFDVESLAFNDTDHLVAERNFTIFNLGNETVQYQLGHRAAPTAYTFDKGPSLSPSEFPNELVSDHATLEISPQSFSVAGGQQRLVSVRVTKPTGLDDARMPVWSGWIHLNSNNESKLSLPYQGVTGSLHNRTVLDVNGTGVAAPDDNDDDALLLGPRTFLLPPAGKSNLTRWAYGDDTLLPTVLVQLALGSRLVRADLIPVNVPGAKFNMTTVLGTQTAGLLADWPMENVQRGSFNQDWDGKLEDGSYAPAGVYKINIKALRIYGDPKKREDYDETETLEFAIEYAFDI